MSDLTRRRMLTGTAGAVAAVALAVPAARATAASEGGHTGHGGQGGQGDREGHAGIQEFDEIYLGRRIEGRKTSGHGHHDFGIAVFIDGRELHIMPRAHGWISVINHYEVFATPYETVRAAVRSLRGAQLVVPSAA